MENDYNKEEIDNVCTELLSVYFSKLKHEEFIFISNVYNKNIVERITQNERDQLMKLYDAIGEVGY